MAVKTRGGRGFTESPIAHSYYAKQREVFKGIYNPYLSFNLRDDMPGIKFLFVYVPV